MLKLQSVNESPALKLKKKNHYKTSGMKFSSLKLKLSGCAVQPLSMKELKQIRNPLLPIHLRKFLSTVRKNHLKSINCCMF